MLLDNSRTTITDEYMRQMSSTSRKEVSLLASGRITLLS